MSNFNFHSDVTFPQVVFYKEGTFNISSLDEYGDGRLMVDIPGIVMDEKKMWFAVFQEPNSNTWLAPGQNTIKPTPSTFNGVTTYFPTVMTKLYVETNKNRNLRISAFVRKVGTYKYKLWVTNNE